MPRIRTDFQQRTPEWQEAKLGKFSGSDFHIMLGDSDTKQDYLWEKIAERKYRDSDKEEFMTFYEERGLILEAEARRMYSALNEVEVEEVGLVEEDGEYDGWAVCSPDGLVGEDGMIEIKCLVAKYFERYTNPLSKKAGYIRPQYKTQVQFNLFVTGRKWCDLAYYHPRGGIFCIRINRDEELISKIKNSLNEAIKTITDAIKEKK